MNCNPTLVVALFLAGFSVALPADGASDRGNEILAAAGARGGVIVCLGCSDGKLLAALHAGGRFVVQGLNTDPAKVETARAAIRAASVYGPVSAAAWRDTTRLPYIDNMVNLLVADKTDLAAGEILRVLAPGGFALVAGRKTAKPRDAALDDWTHYFHDPSNNPVSADTAVGPPRRLQWECGPTWTRNHGRMSSFSAMVSTGGRIFYILDEGVTATLFAPSHWALVARDAFNGKELWRRDIADWYPRLKGYKDGPADAPRRIVAAGKRLFCTLALSGPVSALDAATGATLRDFAGTEHAEELLFDSGKLFVLCGPGSLSDGARTLRPAERRTILALDADTGKHNWQHADVVAALTPALDAQRLYYFNFQSRQVRALDRASGNLLWSSAALPAATLETSYFGARLAVRDGVVLFGGGEIASLGEKSRHDTDDTLTALDAATGRTLWHAPHPPSGWSSPENLFVIDGVAWVDNSSNGRSDGAVIGYDLKTGAVRQKFTCDLQTYWFHHRCYADRATPHFLIGSRSGLEFIDWKTRHWDLNDWVRGACLYGIMPANGLVYTPPAPCICYAEAYLHGFNAYAPASPRPVGMNSGAGRLEHGPAFGQRVPTIAAATDDWPTYRCDNARRGSMGAAGPAELAPAWSVDLGGRLGSLTAAAGMVFVPAIDRHTVHALDAANGTTRWTFTAESRVDSPPTYAQGRVLFGASDGCVYCLRAVDGAILWRLRAAPREQQLLCREQLESSWPVHGSVLVRGGAAYFIAGRSAFVDGGMMFYRVNVATGETEITAPINDRHPDTGGSLQDVVKGLNMPVARADIFSCDEKRLYMRSQMFDFDGKRTQIGAESKRKSPMRDAAHLFAPTGFLDDAWFHRSYWIFGTSWKSGFGGYLDTGRTVPWGRIMCLGAHDLFAYGRQPQFNEFSTAISYRLYAARQEWSADDATGAAGRKSAAKNGKKDLLAGSPVMNPANYLWITDSPVLVRAMTLTGSGVRRTLYIAGPRQVAEDEATLRRGDAETAELMRQQEAVWLGQSGGLLCAVSAADGKETARMTLESPPVFDGMIAAYGKIFLASMNGKVVCVGRSADQHRDKL